MSRKEGAVKIFHIYLIKEAITQIILTNASKNTKQRH